MRLGSYNLLNVAYKLLSYIVRPNQYTVCFISYPDVSDNALALFEYMVTGKFQKFRLVWLVQDVVHARTLLKQANLLRSNVVVAKKKSAYGLMLFLRAKKVFSTHGHFHFVSPTKGKVIVNLWHGMPLKRVAKLDPLLKVPLHHSDITIATSPFFQKVMASAFDVPIEKVLVVGLPRNDWLQDAHVTAPHWLSRYCCDRMVVWMPTYRQSATGDIRADSEAADAVPVLNTSFLSQLNKRLASVNTLCVLKLHPMDVLNNQRVPNFSNILIIDNGFAHRNAVNIYQVLKFADRLVTDYSSVFIDFALLRRPIGFFVPDRRQYVRGLVPEVEEAVGFPGSVLISLAELMDFMTSPAVGCNAVMSGREFRYLHSGYSSSASAGLLQKLDLRSEGV